MYGYSFWVGRSADTEFVVGQKPGTREPAGRSALEGIVVPEWAEDAMCAQTDPEAFFPDKGGSSRAAKEVCRICPVREQCLDYALEHNQRFGIWGGLSEKERRIVARRRSA